jgi:hypothetical protein
LHALGLEVEEIHDERADKLLNHDVLLEKIGEKGVFRDNIGETRHNLVEFTMVVQLLIETKILLLFKDYQIFAHPQRITHSPMYTIIILNLVDFHRLLKVYHK